MQNTGTVSTHLNGTRPINGSSITVVVDKTDRTSRRKRHITSVRATAPSVVPAPSPLRLTDEILAVMVALGDLPVTSLDIADALSPVIGHFTVSDAVLLIDGIAAATGGHICTLEDGGKSDCLGLVVRQLHEFICSGSAAGPACAAARASYALRRGAYPCTWTDEDRRVVSIMLASDIQTLRFGAGQYWCGSQFGGGAIDPRNENEPEDWWELRRRMLSMHRESLGGGR